MVSFCEEFCFNAYFTTNQLPGADEALRANPVYYSEEAFAEDGIVYVGSDTSLLGLLRSNAHLRENCEVDYTNENHYLTLQKYTGLRLARDRRAAISS